MPPKIKHEVGYRFPGTRLTYVGDGPRRGKACLIVCDCDCGNRINTDPYPLRRGKTISCGCYKDELLVARATTHGASKTDEYHIWLGMKARCENPEHPKYADYGERGIRVIWTSFESFLADVGRRPSSVHTIDRIRVNGNYAPGNCRWATPKQQSRNTRVNVNLTYAGKTQCVSAWAEELGRPITTLRKRLVLGWSTEKTLSTSVDKRFANRKVRA